MWYEFLLFLFFLILYLKPPQGGFVRNLRKMKDIVYQNRMLIRRDAVLVSFDYSLLILLENKASARRLG